MPAIQSDAATALDQLKALCAPTTDPVLDDAEDLTPILDNVEVKRATIWSANATHYLGDVVMPTEAKRNGHRYRVIRTDGAGLNSGATEPAWPGAFSAFSQFDDGRRSSGITITDGNLIWQDDGLEYLSLWDIQRAAWLAWDLKVQKLTDSFDTVDETLQLKFSQMIDNCKKQRDRYKPTVIA